MRRVHSGRLLITTLCGAIVALVILAAPATAGAAKSVDNCAIVTPADLQAIFGGTYGSGTPLTTPGLATSGLRAQGFPDTGCAFSTGLSSVKPGLVVSSVGIAAVAGKAGAAAFTKAQKANKSGSTALPGVGKKAFSVPSGTTSVEVYVLDKKGFVRVYAFAERYDTATTKTSIATPALTGQVAKAALNNL